jgi:CheY-like chemotaxis protein
MNRIPEKQQAAELLLESISSSIAIFSANDRMLYSANRAFANTTRFKRSGLLKGNKTPAFEQFFPIRERTAAVELFRIAASLGNAYDFERTILRFPHGQILAEMRLKRLMLGGKPYVLFEVEDLSLSKLYNDLKASHAALRSKVAQLMTIKAEIEFSERQKTITQFGNEFADRLYGPLSVCRTELEAFLPGRNTQTTDPVQIAVTRTLKAVTGVMDDLAWLQSISRNSQSSQTRCDLREVMLSVLRIQCSSLSNLGLSNNLSEVIKDCETSDQIWCQLDPVETMSCINACFRFAEEWRARIRSLQVSFVCKSEKPFSFDMHLELMSSIEAETLHLLSEAVLKAPARHSTSRLSIDVRTEPGACTLRLSSSVPLSRLQTQTKSSTINLEMDPQPQDPSEHDARKKNTQNPLPQNGMVLVVDDDQDIRRLLTQALSRRGFSVFECADGEEAFHWALAHTRSLAERPHVAIICDVRMPNRSGPSFFLELRNLDLQVPFIFFSSHNLQDLAADLNDPNTHFLSKNNSLKFVVDRVTAIACGAPNAA